MSNINEIGINIWIPVLEISGCPVAPKILFGQPVFRKNKGPVARDCAAFAIRTTWIFS